jgi:uncharacterized protein YecE (DUF72 family)
MHDFSHEPFIPHHKLGCQAKKLGRAPRTLRREALARRKPIVNSDRRRYARDAMSNVDRSESGASIRIGPAGWSYEDWIGPVYPPGQGIDKLLMIARYFDCIELNSSFYRTPSERLVRSWADRISERDRFMFTVKVLQRFTHERAGSLEEARRFIHTFDALIESGKVGAFLLQFPWSFQNTPENRDFIGTVGSWFDGFPAAVELRHGSWDVPETAALLAASGLAFCNIDQPLIGASMPPTEIVTQPRLAYIRLHGRNRKNWAKRDAGRDERYDYLYPAGELEEWKERGARIAANAENLYIITNNHFRGQALVNAFQLRHLFGQETKAIPERLTTAYPVLRSIAGGPPAQGTLL